MPNYAYLLRNFDREPGASAEIIHQANIALGLELPPDYIAFLRECNGGSGVIGAHYMDLWAAQCLAGENEEYEVEEYAPELLLVGSNGAGELFAFDKRTDPWSVVMVAKIGMGLDPYIFRAPSFDAFLHLPEKD